MNADIVVYARIWWVLNLAKTQIKYKLTIIDSLFAKIQTTSAAIAGPFVMTKCNGDRSDCRNAARVLPDNSHARAGVGRCGALLTWLCLPPPWRAQCRPKQVFIVVDLAVFVWLVAGEGTLRHQIKAISVCWKFEREMEISVTVAMGDIAEALRTLLHFAGAPLGREAYQRASRWPLQQPPGAHIPVVYLH